MTELYQFIGIQTRCEIEQNFDLSDNDIYVRIYLHNNNIKSHMQFKKHLKRINPSKIMKGLYLIVNIDPSTPRHTISLGELSLHKPSNLSIVNDLYRCVPYLPDIVIRKPKSLKGIKWKAPSWLVKYISQQTGININVSGIICMYTIYPMKYLGCNLIYQPYH